MRRSMQLTCAVLTPLALLVGGCASGEAARLDPVTYLSDALVLLDGGLRASTDDWQQAREAARASITDESSLEDVHDLLDNLASEAGGPHSRFRTPAEVEAWEEEATSPSGLKHPTVEIEDRVGVLTIPGFPLDDPDLTQDYVDAGIAAIQEVADENLCGWVVDLRFNTGGNVHPMLAVASPLLSDGPVLALARPSGELLQAEIDGNSVAVDGEVLAQSPTSPFKIATPSVAVIHAQMTGSAGEAVVIAFYGEDTSRSFGSRTRGFTSGNDYHELADGAGLTVTTGYFHDRLGNTYDGGLDPGVHGSAAELSPNRGETATEWIHSRC